MSRLAELLKQKAPIATPATDATRASDCGKSSNCSESSSRVELKLNSAPNLERLIHALPEAHLHTVLAQRIKSMAIRWRYDLDETREVLALAATDPHGWALAVALDERREQEFLASGILPRFES